MAPHRPRAPFGYRQVRSVGSAEIEQAFKPVLDRVDRAIDVGAVDINVALIKQVARGRLLIVDQVGHVIDLEIEFIRSLRGDVPTTGTPDRRPAVPVVRASVTSVVLSITCDTTFEDCWTTCTTGLVKKFQKFEKNPGVTSFRSQHG